MAQLTPKDILEISEPIEAIYQRTVDDLLVNIARHFNITGWERTRYWEIKKLSEMGALTKEIAAIIAKNTKRTPEEIERAFLEVSQKACLDIDPQLKDAAAKGILQDPGTSATTSPLMRQMVQGYVDQAVDTLNMVNSTMLESTIRAYQQAIQTAVNEAMVQEAKEILEAGALEVVTGQETKVRAIRKAMDQMARAGIPGFYDSRGRAWSPDGYVAMVIRTTSHNAAIKAVQNRQMEYGGGDIFQVSSHPGARPLCYPYQGKFFSWSSGPGEFTDGSGKTQHYDNINDSSYGEPAGLFGINCGHHPIPMIPGYSYPQDGPEQDEEENKKEYEESQKQRQYERQIREAKRDLEVAKATGDEEAVKAAKQKVAQEQAKMRKYTKETGRVRRYDREQIGSLVDTDYGMRDLRKQKVDEVVAPGPKVSLDGIKGISDQDKKELAKMLQACNNDDVKELYTLFADRLECLDDSYRGGANFNAGLGGVRMNAKKAISGDGVHAPGETAFHEFGHMIDFLISRDLGQASYSRTYRSNMIVSSGKNLLDIIKSDFQAFKKSLGVSRAEDVIPILRAENRPLTDVASISDTLEKCTGKSYPLSVGHGVAYHKRPGATEKEFFTEVLASAATNPGGYAQMVRLFPNAVNAVWEMVREVLA